MGSANAYRMLITCGYSPAEASKRSGYTPPPNGGYGVHTIRARMERADANERKYESVVTAEDRIMERFEDKMTSRYDVIEAHRPDVGDCSTRKGVYRKLKFGKGNMTRRGWEKAGFSENRNKVA